MAFSLSDIEKEILRQVSDLHNIPSGAVAVRKNGEPVFSRSTTEIEITPKQNKKGIEVRVKKNTCGKSLHIPVLISENGIDDIVENDFFIEENCDVLIVAGCGIHASSGKSSHNGIHTFHIGKNSKVQYVEKHVGLGGKNAEKILSPTTNIFLEKNAVLEMNTTQISGVSYSQRKTSASLEENAKLVVKEKVLTTASQVAQTFFDVSLTGKNSKCELISRSVAKDDSQQKFFSSLKGLNKCFGRVECDAILLDSARIVSTPEIVAENTDAELMHEAQIGKIANEQLVKLQTLGLTKNEAENLIISSYLN